jgi:hypothetical protein
MKHYVLAMFFLFLITGYLMSGVQTDFIRACKNGNLLQAKELLGNGADVNGVDNVLGWNGLHWATYAGDTNLVSYLLTMGADYKAKAINGLTPYDIALSNNNKDMIFIYQTLAVVDVDENIPSGKGVFSPDTIAIMIGNQNYENGIPKVQYAFNDVDVMRKYMIKTFGIPEQKTRLIRDLTKANFDGLFGQENNYTKSKLYREVNTGKYDLIIYYSGHGAPSASDLKSGRGFLVPVDADVSTIDMTGYGVDTLLNNIKSMKNDGVLGNVWIIFDSCFSGDSGGGMLLKNVSPVGIRVSNPLMATPNSILMYSSSGSELSSWYPEKRHGMFTYYLLKAFSGEALKNGSKNLTVGDLKNYISSNVSKRSLKITGQNQTPQIITLDNNKTILHYK